MKYLIIALITPMFMYSAIRIIGIENGTFDYWAFYFGGVGIIAILLIELVSISNSLKKRIK